ncbi:MAG: hypothetical protein MUD10_03995, partial [Candidatus Pacebacteria bacterium]|nr:hypothetical protein [Candidatus Paceibacterota bacterium]
MFKNIVIALAGILLLFYAFTAFAATNLSTYKPSTGTNLSTYKPSTAVNTSNLDGLYYSYVAEDKNDWLSCTDISCGSNYSSGNNYSYDYTYDYTYTKTTTTTTCSNQCSIVGQRQCSGNGYQECYKGSDGCLHWGSTNNCGTNQKCVNGSCIYFETCTDECSISGKRECSGNGYRTCGNYDSDSCKEWSTVTNCASDETCSNGSCVKKPPVCTDECSVSGQRTCSGNGFKTCSKGSDGCFHWGAVTNCSTDEYCSNGSCIEKQINICSDTLSGSPSSREQNLCSAAGGTMQCGNGWCKCNCEKPQPTVNLTSSGNATCSERAKLTWTSTNATSCTASNGWSGSKSTSGSEELGQFTGSKTFTLKCTGAGGTATDSVTITGTEDQLDVDAGDDDDVDAGDYITLDGSVDGDYDSISWSCNGGNLSNKNSLRAKLDTDENDGGDTITCTLTAKNECGSDSDSVKIKVKETTTDFNVTLEADPTSGCAPLRDVDLKARLTNASSSDIDYTYYFDCESDGDWDKTITTSAKSYTAANVCDFANVGSYTAKVKVTGKGRTVTDSETIRANNCSTPVYEKAGNVSITKNVRNVSSGTGYMGTVSAIPGNTVS